MRVRVRLVSLLREAVGGRQELELELPGDSARLGDVVKALYERYPSLGKLVRELEDRGLNIVYMVNGQGASEDAAVRDGDTVTVLPPASGG